MKKAAALSMILFVFGIDAFALSYSPDFKPNGLAFEVAVDYGKTFKGGTRIINLEFFGCPFPARPVTLDFGMLTLFSPDVCIFDVYAYGGFTYYPFNKVLSLSVGWGIGCSIYAFFNHFPYMANAKVNIDIPVDKSDYAIVHALTLGAGVQHRNAAKIIGYIESDDYYGVYNSYFFEICYRLFINQKRYRKSETELGEIVTAMMPRDGVWGGGGMNERGGASGTPDRIRETMQ